MGIILSGCGVVYKSPSVGDGKTDAGINVDVVPLTFNSADFANRLAPYTPKPLPQSLKVFGGPSLTGARGNARPGFPSRWPEPLPAQSYRLGVGDALLLSPPGSFSPSVAGTAQSSMLAASTSRQKYTVQDDGSISVPEIGRIRVEGLSLPQIEQAIFQALLERQMDPSFSVEIAEFNSQRVNVAGLVMEPATLPITLTPLYLREALSAAGGSRIANLEDTTVTLHRDGQSYNMMLSDIYTEPKLGRHLLKDGDSIFVNSLYYGDRVQPSALSSDRSAIAEQIEIGAYPQDRVYLVGEVKKQIQIALPFEQKAKLADVLFSEEGGGFDLKTANVGQIYVLRLSQLSGRVTAYHLDAENIASLVVATALEMRPNDFVFIAEQRITAWNRVIQQMMPQIFVSVANSVSN